MTQFADTFETGTLTTNWPTRNGNVSATAAAAYSGSYGARMAPGGGTAAQIATSTTKWAQGSLTYAFIRMRLRMNSLPSGVSADLITLQNQTTADNFDFYWNYTTGTFWFDLAGATAWTDTGISPEVGRWYDVQAIVFYGSTTYTAHVQVDDTVFPLLSSAGETSSFVRSLHIGTFSTSKTYSFDVDNVVANVGTNAPSFEVHSTMSKTGGLGDNLYVGGYDISGDIQAIDRIGGGPAALEFTDITQFAHARQGGVRDGAIEATTFFNAATGQAHPVLSALPTADVVVTYCRGTTLGNAAACVVAKQVGYDPTRDTSGNLTLKTSAQANGYGLEWGVQLTAGLRTDTAATNGSSVDLGSGSISHGLQAYLQVTAFTGTDATVKLQSSSDDGVGDAWADVTGGSFTAVTAANTAERIATSATATIERYLRVVTTTSAGFTSCTFNVVVRRNATAPSF